MAVDPQLARMLSEQEWAPGTPERAVADAFDAFRRRDVARFARMATNASLRVTAARIGRDLGEVDSANQAAAPEEMSDSRAEAILGRVMALLPVHFTDMVRCLIVGRVLEARIVDFDQNRDGRGMFWFECRVTDAEDAWIGADSPWRIDDASQAGAEHVAHVVFHAAFDFPDKGVVPFPFERQIATTRLVDGEWKLVLDEHSVLGLPGYRGMGFWMDPRVTGEQHVRMPQLIIRSGGQSGVDRAALDVAIRRGLRAVGWCPRGGWAEDYPTPPGVLRDYSFLVETPTAETEQRAAWNVRDSDATLVMSAGDPSTTSPGTRFTIVCAELVFARPTLVIEPANPSSAATAASWLELQLSAHAQRAFVLNVAGPRESEVPGIALIAARCLDAVLDLARVQSPAVK